jgi:hypothetical protein
VKKGAYKAPIKNVKFKNATDMTTLKSNNGTYSITGLTAEQLAVINALIEDAKVESANIGDDDEEVEISTVLSSEEVEILNTINIEF